MGRCCRLYASDAAAAAGDLQFHRVCDYQDQMTVYLPVRAIGPAAEDLHGHETNSP